MDLRFDSKTLLLKKMYFLVTFLSQFSNTLIPQILREYKRTDHFRKTPSLEINLIQVLDFKKFKTVELKIRTKLEPC